MGKNYMHNKHVFVTGGLGFLAGHLIDELIKKGAKVTTLIRDWTYESELIHSGNIKRVNVIRGGLEEAGVVERVINEYEIETIFHLGAQTIVSIANISPISTFESNIQGTWNLLDAARKAGKGVKAIIIASSDKAYGTAEKLPYEETLPLRGEHPYDVSKSCADLIANSYYKTYKLPIAITRCGNIYGGGDINYNRLIPGTIRSFFKNENPIIRSDGLYIRDYFYIKDAVDAYIMLAEKIEEKSLSGEAFNFSTGERYTVLEVVDLIAKLMRIKGLPPIVKNDTKGEIKEQSLSCLKAYKILGWKAKWPLKIGLCETIESYRKIMWD